MTATEARSRSVCAMNTDSICIDWYVFVPLEFNLLRAGSTPPSTVVVITQSPSLHSDSLGFLKAGDDERAYTRARTHVQRFQRISALPDTRSFLYRASENHWNTLTYF